MNNEKAKYYRSCLKCGAAFDRSEVCECERVHSEADALKLEITRLMKTASVSDLRFVLGYLKA